MQLTDGGFTNAQASMRLSAYDPMRPHMQITIGANLAPSLAPECGIYVCVCCRYRLYVADILSVSVFARLPFICACVCA